MWIIYKTLFFRYWIYLLSTQPSFSLCTCAPRRHQGGCYPLVPAWHWQPAQSHICASDTSQAGKLSTRCSPAHYFTQLIKRRGTSSELLTKTQGLTKAHADFKVL